MPKFEKGNTMWKRAAGNAGARTRAAQAGEETVRAGRDAPPSPVVFICNAVPALGLALPTGMYSFERGRLELTDPADIARIRKLPWYGVRIFEQAGGDDPGAPPPVVPAASNPTSGAGLMFRRHLVLDQQRGWRCKDCGDASPSFPVEGAAIAHLQMFHRIGATQGGSDHGTQA